MGTRPLHLDNCARRFGARRCVLLIPTIVLMAGALAASPATNPASGKFDNLALRAGTQSSATTQKSSAAGEPSALDGLDTRRVALSLAAVISLILLLRFVARKFFPNAGSVHSSAARVLSRTVVSPR